MIPVREAETIILSSIQPLQDREIVGLTAARDRILARAVTSGLDFPHDDNSAMDGYAVRFTDVADGGKPVALTLGEEIPAGAIPQKNLQPGEAARIFTGGLLPVGADTIVMQENTRVEGDRVWIEAAPDALGAFVRRRGAFYRAGEPLLPAGSLLGPPEIAVLAAAQIVAVPVVRQPRVAILSTGDELVPPDRPLARGQIVDSNGYALAAFVEACGAVPVPIGIVRDRPEELRAAMERAIASADLVLSTGGVSVGAYDFVEELLADLGGEIRVRSVAIKPGKPLTVASFPNCLYFGLPGNPVSALASCWRFVGAALRKCSGRSQPWEPPRLRVLTLSDLKAGGKRETYLWGNLTLRDGRYRFQLAAGSHSSGNLINLAQTNALAIVPVGQTEILAGSEVEVLLQQGV